MSIELTKRQEDISEMLKAGWWISRDERRLCNPEGGYIRICPTTVAALRAAGTVRRDTEHRYYVYCTPEDAARIKQEREAKEREHQKREQARKDTEDGFYAAWATHLAKFGRNGAHPRVVEAALRTAVNCAFMGEYEKRPE
jgi:hypothetical protein